MTRTAPRIANQVDPTALPALRTVIANAGLNLQAESVGAAIAVNPGLLGILKHEAAELAAAAQARALVYPAKAADALYARRRRRPAGRGR